MELYQVVVEFELNNADEVERAANLVVMRTSYTSFLKLKEETFKGSDRARVAYSDMMRLCSRDPVLRVLYEEYGDDIRAEIVCEKEHIPPSMAEREPQIIVENGGMLRFAVKM